MIQSASFRNFKSLRHVDVEFERLTVFVGPNASGKTSILEGLNLLSRVASSRRPTKLFSGRRDPLLLYTRGVKKKELKITCCAGVPALRVRLTPPWLSTRDAPDSEPSESLGSGWTLRIECDDTKDPSGGWCPISENPSRAQEFRSSALLRLEASSLTEPSYSQHPRPRVKTDGQGMASALALMALNQPDSFSLLQERIKTVVPALKRIRFDRVPVTRMETEVVTIDSDRLTRRIQREYIADEVVLDFEGAPDIPAHLASEGTILVLGLLAVLMGPVRPKLVLIDDLDHGLHPKAQRKLIPLLRTILEESPNLQIVATTHSPYVVNELDPKEVRITWAGDDGMTQCARLDTHPDFERWKEELWPGEFWSLVGEAMGREWPRTGEPVMALSFVVVCEARADFETASELADRVICELIDWIESDTLHHHRRYDGHETGEPFLAWRRVKALAKESRIRPRGFIDGQPTDLDAEQARRALVYIEAIMPGADAILLIRDDDRQVDRRRGLEQARNASPLAERIVIGLAHTKRECWVLAGFEPCDERERELLAEIRQELGFDPRIQAEQLTAIHDHNKRSAKRVLKHLAQGDHDRESACWREAKLHDLHHRGGETGLRQYLEEIEERLVPLLDPSSRR